MPKIKTRKVIQESLKTNKIKQQEEPTPESSATNKVENGAKRTAQNTSYFVGYTAKKYIRSKQAQKSAEQTAKATKVAKEGAKVLAETGKTLVSAIISSGWIGAVIILVVCLVVCFGAFFISGEDGGALQTIALSQVGNIGGEPYWSWYGFDSRVEWCACFVSWCAEQCGYIQAEIIPKYSGCSDGVYWFKNHEQWLDRTEKPSSGMIIFFDWDEDGVSDHTGIVTSIENQTITTVEGNSNDSVEINQYAVGDTKILGYGVPIYIPKKDAST